MRKSWVILLFNDKKLKIWRTYENKIWDSPLYTVMGTMMVPIGML